MYDERYVLTREGALQALKREALCLADLDSAELKMMKDLEREGLITTSHAFGWTYYVLPQPKESK